MKRTLFAACLLLPLSLGMAHAQQVVVTGSNGGTATANRDCVRVPGQTDCNTATTLTAPNGQTATRSRNRTTTAGHSQTTVTATGPNGASTSRGRTVLVTRY